MELDLPSSDFFDIMMAFSHHNFDLMVQKRESYLLSSFGIWRAVFRETILYQMTLSALVISHDGHSERHLGFTRGSVGCGKALSHYINLTNLFINIGIIFHFYLSLIHSFHEQ